MSSLTDSFGRTMGDLRISVTDRCNFRCMYCLPETEEAADFYRSRANRSAVEVPQSETVIRREWKPKSELLTFEEIERFSRVAVDCGITKLRITGGEPLLRRDLEILIGRLANIPGVDDLAMTTNGIGFVSRAQRLKDSGLRRVTFSLDSLARGVFKTLTGRDALNAVLESIQVAQKLKFEPLKINVVLIRGINDTEILPLVEFARERDIAIRFIEFMPLDSKRSWQRDLVIASNEILDVVKSKYSIVSSDRENPSDTAKKWEFSDGRGGLGIIAPITDPFCGNCNRLRLTADGKIRTCLFSTGEHDVRGLLRQECSDEELKVYLESIVLKKEVGHRIGREDFVPPARSMSYIGG